MKRKPAAFCLLLAFCLSPARADKYVVVDKTTGAEIPVNHDGGGGRPVFRADIQSTSVDWEAVSGLRLGEYKITFSGAKAAGNIGWEMYFLDGFPCYGFAQYTRTWINSNNTDGYLRANCLRRPKEISLAYRAAKKDAPQGRTTGILTCPVDKKQVADLTKCSKQDWADFEK
jgi:hypothetical protein